jgi:hypothetical protein
LGEAVVRFGTKATARSKRDRFSFGNQWFVLAGLYHPAYRESGAIWGKSVSQRDDEADRLEKFRAMADEAREAARNAKTAQLREEYENLVRAWEMLIAEMESLEAAREKAGSSQEESSPEPATVHYPRN